MADGGVKSEITESGMEVGVPQGTIRSKTGGSLIFEVTGDGSVLSIRCL